MPTALAVNVLLPTELVPKSSALASVIAMALAPVLLNDTAL